MNGGFYGNGGSGSGSSGGFGFGFGSSGSQSGGGSDDFLIDKKYLKQFVAECEKDKVKPPNERIRKLVEEGDRVSNEFRRLFPDVSDKDLGTMIITFVQVFVMIADTQAIDLGNVLQKVCGTYAYAGANIIKGVLDIDSLND
jgi:hypothetical protein